MCRQTKWAQKCQTVLVLPSQILIYFCVGEQSKLENSSCFSKLNPNVLIIDEQSEPKNFWIVLLCMWAKLAKKYEIIFVLPSQILIY